MYRARTGYRFRDQISISADEICRESAWNPRVSHVATVESAQPLTHARSRGRKEKIDGSPAQRDRNMIIRNWRFHRATRIASARVSRTSVKIHSPPLTSFGFSYISVRSDSRSDRRSLDVSGNANYSFTHKAGERANVTNVTVYMFDLITCN